MSGFAEYADYDGLGLAALVRNSDVSATELLDEAVARTEQHNGALNAVT
jgi:amidase